MPTGDGLLVRMLPIGTIALEDFGTLCVAAREHGNGVIEITARGSIQVRPRRASPMRLPRSTLRRRTVFACSVTRSPD